MGQQLGDFVALQIAILTVSDTRSLDSDTSGALLESALIDAGHSLASRQLVKDDIYAIRAIISQWINEPAVQVVLVTGGTGFGGRDSTPEAIEPLFDKTVDGFGELFRSLSFEDIGSSTIQSRALAGVANDTILFALPGSTGACQPAWDKILREQLDRRHRPCNFVGALAAH